MKNRSVIVKNFVQLATQINKNNTLSFPLKVTFSPENARILIEEESCKQDCNECPSTLSLIEGNIYKGKFSF